MRCSEVTLFTRVENFALAGVLLSGRGAVDTRRRSCCKCTERWRANNGTTDSLTLIYILSLARKF